jgi:flagellar motility protein MotE (MotC chaperone)
VEIKADEIPNLKRLAKSYATMTPAGAAAILREMEDNAVVKILVVMKDTENGPILEAMGRQGPADATRAAALTEKLRLARAPAAKAKP